MRRILTTPLIGLLSLFIHFSAIAADEAPNDESAASAPETMNAASDTSPPVISETSSDTVESSSSEPDAEQAPEETEPVVEEKPQPAILGESIEVVSLRGSNAVADDSEEFPNRRIMVVDGGIDVSFGDQPPMIPHNIDKDRISLQENTCLKCHSRVDSKLENAPKPTPSHFKSRDGKKQKKIVAGRYFCTQCHTPQANTKPLIKNTFTN